MVAFLLSDWTVVCAEYHRYFLYFNMSCNVRGHHYYTEDSTVGRDNRLSSSNCKESRLSSSTSRLVSDIMGMGASLSQAETPPRTNRLTTLSEKSFVPPTVCLLWIRRFLHSESFFLNFVTLTMVSIFCFDMFSLL